MEINKAKSIDEYIAKCPEEIQEKLNNMRAAQSKLCAGGHGKNQLPNTNLLSKRQSWCILQP